MSDPPVPDVPQALLGFRVWQWDLAQQSLIAVTAGDYPWPPGQPLHATCDTNAGFDEEDDGWHRVPDPDCGCGIYVGRDIRTVSRYGCRAKVFGIAQVWGRVLPFEYVYRAEHAKVAAILALLPEAEGGFVLPHDQLQNIAALYRVPFLAPHSAHVEHYRAEVEAWQPPVADDDFNRQWFAAQEKWEEDGGEDELGRPLGKAKARLLFRDRAFVITWQPGTRHSSSV